MSPDILTFGISTLVGIVGRLFAESLSVKRLKAENKLARSKEQREGYSQARNAPVSSRFALTRQIIALSIILSTVVLPKLTPLFWPTTTVYYCDYAAGKSFLFGLFTWPQILDCYSAVGLFITPIDVQLSLAVAGLYLGATVATGHS